MSTVKVNTVDKRTGGTLTLGGCGTTVTLGAGATQSGFGRTGTVDWCTTAKTAPFTGVSGNGYFVNTTCGAVTVTLPATPSAGDIISIADYASTFNTNNLTLCRNSSKINGVCGNSILNTEGQSITLVYVDGTRGWKNTMDSTSNVSGAPNYVVATGGTISCCGDYKIHTFTSDGTFTICSAPTPANNNVDYLVVAGGGGAGGNGAGGGGAGGARMSSGTTTGCYAASPLGACVAALPVSVTSYPITVGAGGSGQVPSGPTPTTIGSVSTFSTITSAGGGQSIETLTPTRSGGSGGGGRANSANPGNGTGGAGNTPPTSPSQGNRGGNNVSSSNYGAGGGGAGGQGSDVSTPGCTPQPQSIGGVGIPNSISASALSYAGGGSGGYNSASGAPNLPSPCGTGGTGGTANNHGGAGTTNRGGGGGGGAGTAPGANGGAGGSGVVIIRYKYQ
jgi:hypothetical protein